MNWPPKNKQTLLDWQEAFGTDKCIAEAAGCDGRTVRRYRKRFGIEVYGEHRRFDCGLCWPPRSREEMQEWIDYLETDEEIAEYVGRSPGTVANQRQRNGFTKRPHMPDYKPWQMSEEEVANLYAGREYEDWGRG